MPHAHSIELHGVLDHCADLVPSIRPTEKEVCKYARLFTNELAYLALEDSDGEGEYLQ